MKIAILDEYQNVVTKMADWSSLSERAEISKVKLRMRRNGIDEYYNKRPHSPVSNHSGSVPGEVEIENISQLRAES